MRTPSWREDRRKTSERGYGWRWQQARLLFLADHPLCEMCQTEKKVKPATVVDHRVPHKGDDLLFWDERNWQALCAHHHNSDKQLIDSGKQAVRFGPDGYPVQDAEISAPGGYATATGPGGEFSCQK